jgi:hypothetical protein
MTSVSSSHFGESVNVPSEYNMDDLFDLDIPLNETKKQNKKNNLKKAIKEYIASMDTDGDNSTIGIRELATKHSCDRSTLQRRIVIITQMIEQNKRIDSC